MGSPTVNWNPDQYLKFGDHRLRPALDLLARIDLKSPRAMYDLGCGTGNTTELLSRRWPDTNVTGIDSSPEMLEKARGSCPELNFAEADLASWSPESKADLLFSNAALHWLGHHESLFPRLMEVLSKGGQVAVQMPRNFDAPSHTAMRESVEAGPWAERLQPRLHFEPVAEPEAYHDILAPHSECLDIWETVYLYVLEGNNPVVEWTRGTALRPLLELLQPDEQEDFLEDYSRRILEAYPPQSQGRTLFPFRRLFMVATR